MASQAENNIRIVLEAFGVEDINVKLKILKQLLAEAGDSSFSSLEKAIPAVSKKFEHLQAEVKATLDELQKVANATTKANGGRSKSGFHNDLQSYGKEATIALKPEVKEAELQKAFDAIPSPIVKVNTDLPITNSPTYNGATQQGQSLDFGKNIVGNEAKTLKLIQAHAEAYNKSYKEQLLNAKTAEKRLEITQAHTRFLNEMDAKLKSITASNKPVKLVPDGEIAKAKTLISTGRKFIADNKETTKSIQEQERAQEKLNKTVNSGSKALDTAIGKLIRYRVAFFVMRGAIDGVKDSITTFIDLQYKLAELTIVINRQTTSIEELQKAGFELGKEFGGAIGDIVDAYKIWAQTGLNQNEILAATRATLIGVNVLGGTTKEVTESLTAAIFTYGIAVEDVTTIISKWLSVQREFPISAKDLAASLKIVGAAAQVVGVDLDDLSGYVAAIGSITRKSGAAIGQSLKTMFARLPRKEVISAFEGIGVAVLKTADEIRDLDDILKELSGKWKDLSNVQKSNLAVTFGGIRRYADFIALMDNYQTKLAATVISQRATTEAQDANAIILATFQKQWEQTKVAVSEFGYEVGKLLSGPLKSLLVDLESLVGGTDGASKSLSSGTAKFIAFSSAAGGVFIALSSLKFVGVKVAATLASLGTAFEVEKAKALGAAGANKLFSLTLGEMAVAARAALFSMAGLNALFLALSVVAGIWAFSAVGATDAANNFGEAISESAGSGAVAKFKKSRDEIKALRKELELLEGAPSSLQKLVDGINGVGESAGTSKTQLAIFDGISRGLGTISSELGVAVNNVALSFGNEAQSLDEVNKLIKENIDLKKQQLYETIKITEENKTLALEEIKSKLAEQKAINDGVLLYKEFAKAKAETLEREDAVKGGSEKEFDRVIIQKLKDDLEKALPPDVFELLQKKLGSLSGEKLDSAIRNIILSTGSAIVDYKKLIEDFTKGEDIDTTFFIGKKLSKEVLDFNKNLDSAVNKFINATQGISKRVKGQFPLAEKEFISLFPKDANISSIFQTEIDDLILQTRRLKFGELIDPEIFQVKAADSFLQETDSLLLTLKNQITNADENIANLELAQRALLKAQKDLTKQAPGGIGPGYFPDDSGEKLKQEAEKIFAFLDADIRNALLESENIPKSLNDLFNENIKTTKELRERFDALSESEKRAFALEILDNYVKKQKEVVYALREINEVSGIRTSVLEQQVAILGLFPKKLDEQYKIQKQIIDLELAAGISSARAKIDDQEEYNALLKANDTWLNKAIKAQDSLTKSKLNKIWSEVAENAKIFASAISSGVNSVPDTLTEGVTQRKDLGKELLEAEKELNKARAEGDAQAISDAQYRIDTIKSELDLYKAGWYEIRTVILDVFGNLANTVWQKFSDKVADDIANITIGGETIGDSIGTAITNTTSVFVTNWKEAVTNLNVAHQTALQSIYREHEARLREINNDAGRKKAISEGDSTQLFESLAKSYPNGAPVSTNPDIAKPIPVIVDENNNKDINKNTQALKSLGNLLAITAGQAGSAAITGSGAGQQAGSSIGGIAGLAIGGPVGGGVGSLLGGLFGGLFDKEQKVPEQIEAITTNTEAVLNNTIALKELDKALFNAPTGFNVSPASGGGFSGKIEVNISSNGDATEIANQVITAINEQLDKDASSSGTRGFSPN